MAKKDLFCIKTNKGYGLFQEYDSYPNIFREPFYLVYYRQVERLNEIEIAKSLKGEYYYVRIGFDVWDEKFSKDKLLGNPCEEYSAQVFGIDEEDPYYGKCKISYLGKYELPSGVEIPRFSRLLSINYYTGKFKWYIHDEVKNELVRNERNKTIIYKRIDDDIKNHPGYYGIPPMEILKRFNADYRQSDDDNWIMAELEEYYQQYPNMRPVELNYCDVKYPLPSEEMRSMNEQNEDEQDKKRYAEFCDKVEELCLAFLNAIEQDKKSAKKHLITILDGLNELYDKTGLIETMEAEILYTYLSNILISIRKRSLIDNVLEERRNW